MNRIMKGYGVGSVLERTSYSKQLLAGRISSSRAVLELDVYKRDNGTKRKLWQLVKKEKK